MKTNIAALIFLVLASVYFPRSVFADASNSSSIEPQKGRWICTVSGAGKKSRCFWQK